MQSKRLSIEDKSTLANEEHVRIQAMFDSIGTGAIAIDADGKIERINDRGLELLGFNRRELIGKWFPETVVALDENKKVISTMDRPITQSFLSGRPVSTRAYYRTKDKSILPVNITVSPIIVGGKPLGAIEVFEDISLELQIDKMKSEFISIASHQLRTPLSAIHVYSQMLMDGYNGKLNELQQESLKIILDATHRMNKLISALLDISKLENGRINIKYSLVDLSDLLEKTLEDLKHSAESKEQTIIYNKKGKVFTLDSDPLLVGEIYSNLISNAIKYTPPGGQIEISLKENRDKFVFCVKDSGIGIPANFHNKIFSKFSRADNVQSVDTNGSGLGLYMANEIAQILNGRLWFKSKQNVGTNFYFAISKS